MSKKKISERGELFDIFAPSSLEFKEAIALVDEIIKAGFRKQSEGTWKTHSVSYECSRCGEEFFIADIAEDYDAIEDLKMNYCPNCGAKMKGGERE